METSTSKLPEDVEKRFIRFMQDIGNYSLPTLRHFLASELDLQTQSHALELAEAQLLGFHHGRSNRDDLLGLIESMGLTKNEWEKMQPIFGMAYLTDEDRKEIEQALKEKSV